MRVLILDSNSLFTPDDRKVFKPKFESTLRQCRDLYPLEVFVPRLVLSEIAYRKCIACENLRRNYRKISSTLSEILEVTPSTELDPFTAIRSKLYRRYLAQCKQNQIKIVRTSFEKIEWKKLVTAAVQRKPPFSDGESEKGFRDALIYETARQVVIASSSNQVTLLTSDGRMQQAVKENTTWSVAADIEEYLSTLKLERADIAAARFHLFFAVASQEFFDPNDQSCLFVKGNVVSSIRRQFADQLASIPRATELPDVYFADRTALLRFDSHVFVVGPSLYQGSTNGVHAWKVSVRVLTPFETRTEGLFGFSHDFIRTISFDVVWSAVVSEGGEFSSEIVNNISLVATSIEKAGVMDLVKYGFPLTFRRLIEHGQISNDLTSEVRVMSPSE